jgi:hypothetical protein
MMVLLGDVGQVEARFSLFGDSINLDAIYVHGLRRTFHRLGNHFGWYQMVLLCDVSQVELVLVHLEIVLISAQDRCTVCAECTMGMAIILGTPNGTPM